MKHLRRFLLPLFSLALGVSASGAEPIKTLILDGQNNHDWQSSTVLVQRALEDTGLFAVEVATAPAKGADMSGYRPRFSGYAVVVSNYNGAAWPKETQAAFVDFVRNGGGFVVIHSASNAFPEWPEYNVICGLGGWEGRNEKSGPWLYWNEKIIRDPSPGRGGDHGALHEFQVVAREPDHPILRGLPTVWLHGKDELYNRLRGPAENLTVLATAFDTPAIRGSGRHEPILMTVNYGRGRVFHTTLGHVRDGNDAAMRCVGFVVTLQRGTEWVATGQVTLPAPANFPSAEKVSLQ